jgi:hypothetical protein
MVIAIVAFFYAGVATKKKAMATPTVATPLWPSVRMKLTFPKLGTWSPLRLPNV